MKKVTIIIIAICCLLLSYYSGKQVAYYEDEDYIDDLMKLSLYSEELLDMYYDHDSDFYLDTICVNDAYQDYINLRSKLFNE